MALNHICNATDNMADSDVKTCTGLSLCWSKVAHQRCIYYAYLWFHNTKQLYVGVFLFPSEWDATCSTVHHSIFSAHTKLMQFTGTNLYTGWRAASTEGAK